MRLVVMQRVWVLGQFLEHDHARNCPISEQLHCITNVFSTSMLFLIRLDNLLHCIGSSHNIGVSKISLTFELEPFLYFSAHERDPEIPFHIIIAQSEKRLL